MASTVAAPTTVANVKARPVYTRVAALGLLFIAATPIFFTIAGLLAGQSLAEEGVFFAIVAVGALVGATLVWRLGLPGRIAGIVFSLLAGMAMFWTAFGLAAPAAFADFVGGVLLPSGVLMGLGGSIAAIVSARKGRVATEATRGESRIMMIAVGLLALAILFSGIMTLTGKTTVDAAAAEGATAVAFSSFKFVDDTYTVPAGETKMVVHNSDAFVHDFAIPALGVDPVVVNPGSEKLVEFSAEPGTYIMFCTLHSNTSSDTAEGQMAATLVVE
jgi:plastocyanin